ncbi:MAG: hypothetical protein R3E90_15145 [Marinicella sp.]
MNQKEVIDRLNLALKAFAEMIYQFDVPQAEVWKLVRWHLAHIAKANSDEDESQKNIAARAGLDRNSYAKFIKEPPPETKPSNLSALITTAYAQSDDGELSIKEFYEISEKVMRSTMSPQNTLEELISRKVITFKENSSTHIIICNEGLYTSGMSESYVNVFSSTLNKVITTLLHNRDAKESDQLFQANFYSTQMPLNQQREFKQYTRDEFWALRVRLRKKIEELEKPELPVGAFSEVGVSLLQTYLSKHK